MKSYSQLISDVQLTLPRNSIEYYRDNWGYTALDSLMGVYVVEQLKSYWPFSSLDNEITFKDTFKAEGIVESIALILTKA